MLRLARAIQTQSILTAILWYRGTINLTGQSGFDFDGSATYTGGDIIINGEKQTKIENSMPGGGGPQGGSGPQGGGPAGGFGGGH